MADTRVASTLTRAAPVAVALIALAAWSFWQRWQLLMSSPYPLGVDGYFYPIQLRSLLDTGALYYPSAPLALWLMAPLAAITDPITGAKLGAALGGALAVFPFYVLGRRIGGGRACGLLAAILVASSAQSLYLSHEFVKSGLGVTVAASFLCALAWALEAPSRRRVAIALAMLLATALTHKLAFGFALIASIGPLAIAWRARVIAIPGRWLALALAALAACALIAGLLAPRRFLALGDLSLIGDMVRGDWDWSLPALAVPGGAPLMFRNEVAYAGALALATIAVWLAARWLPWLRAPATSTAEAINRAMVAGPIAFALIAAAPFLDVTDPQGLAFRLRIIAFASLALCAAYVAGAAFARVAALWRLAAVIPFVVAFVIAYPAVPGEGKVQVHPAMQSAVRALRGVVPASDVIIVPERHIAFMAAWFTENSVRLRPEPVPKARRWRLLPMALMTPDLQRALDQARRDAPAHILRPRGLHPRARNGLVVMPEATWQWILTRLPAGQRAHYQRWVTI